MTYGTAAAVKRLIELKDDERKDKLIAELLVAANADIDDATRGKEFSWDTNTLDSAANFIAAGLYRMQEPGVDPEVMRSWFQGKHPYVWEGLRRLKRHVTAVDMTQEDDEDAAGGLAVDWDWPYDDYV